MAKTIQLAATARDRAGKGAARATRREGRVPGVIYGDRKDPQLISLSYHELWPYVQTGRFLSTLVEVSLDGGSVRAIPRDIQFDPVRDRVIHVDFLRLGAGARIAVEVPVRFINHEAAPGIKRGGVLNVVRHEVELYCPAESIPEQLTVDLTGLEIGDSIHISHIQLPEGTSPTITGRDFTVATIAAPAGLKEELKTEEGAEEAEPGEVPATAQKPTE